jgi:hypothetical protein
MKTDNLILRGADGSFLQDHQERILRALVCIDTHPREELTLDQLARVAKDTGYDTHAAFTRGLVDPGAQFIGISRDDPKITAADQLRYDACITVD